MKILPNLSRRTDDKTGVKFKRFKDHEEMANRLTKTFYYGKNPQTDRPSLAMTDIAVELFSNAVPNVGLDQIDMHYAATVSRNACASPCSLMLALVYIDRLRRTNPEYLKTVSSSDIFLVSMMIASKFLYDEGEEEVFNEEWAASANMETKEINQIEREFLAALDWNLYVDIVTLHQVLHVLESQIALKEGLKRGWFTYTDLEILSQNLPGLESLSLFFENVFKVALACAVAYTAGVLILVGANVFVHRTISPGTWLLNPPPMQVKALHTNQKNFNNESFNVALQLDKIQIKDSFNCNLCSSKEKQWAVANYPFASRDSGLLEETNNFSLSSIVLVDVNKNNGLSFESSTVSPSIQECLCKNRVLYLQDTVVESACSSNPSPITVLSR